MIHRFPHSYCIFPVRVWKIHTACLLEISVLSKRLKKMRRLYKWVEFRMFPQFNFQLVVLTNPWIIIIHNEPIRLPLCQDISGVSLEQDNLFSFHYIMNRMKKYTLKAHLLVKGHCVIGAEMFQVSFPSTYEVNDDATLVIYYVVFSNIKLISKSGLMNCRHDETKGT